MQPSSAAVRAAGAAFAILLPEVPMNVGLALQVALAIDREMLDKEGRD